MDNTILNTLHVSPHALMLSPSCRSNVLVKVSFAKTTTLVNPHTPGTRKPPPKLILSHPTEPSDGPETPIGPLPVTMMTSTPLTNGLRSRGPRQVSWGPPPPPALISSNPLPFKIDETPESPA
uniref:Uncharacterized protein n=1 Tax=Anopheles culicifacies TaxID=139723 RepID=A0A182M5U2_9DIPT